MQSPIAIVDVLDSDFLTHEEATSLAVASGALRRIAQLALTHPENPQLASLIRPCSHAASILTPWADEVMHLGFLEGPVSLRDYAKSRGFDLEDDDGDDGCTCGNPDPDPLPDTPAAVAYLEKVLDENPLPDPAKPQLLRTDQFAGIPARPPREAKILCGDGSLVHIWENENGTIGNLDTYYAVIEAHSGIKLHPEKKLEIERSIRNALEQIHDA